MTEPQVPEHCKKPEKQYQEAGGLRHCIHHSRVIPSSPQPSLNRSHPVVPLQASSLSLPGLAPGRAAPTASPPSSPRSAFFYIPCYCPSCYLLGPTTKIVLGPLTTRLFIVQHCRPHLNLLAHINGNLFKLWRVSVCLSSKDNLVWGGLCHLLVTSDKTPKPPRASVSISVHVCTHVLHVWSNSRLC